MDDGMIALDPAEIDRFGRAIARIVEREYPPESAELTTASNTYATAFQFLVMRRGPEYGLMLGRAAEARALEILAVDRHDLIEHSFAGIHEKVSRENEKLD
jgi:hypothetical protein